ncbi:AAA family ATPase [Micromonospora sp. CA-240977]|uniref:AAA family ATPase n=1 Tax=Micromonospora sp. CA-240977 TaxID=3239957 RepID=UPI003D91A128
MVGEKRPGARRAKLFLTVGLPCTGKTTAARRIKVECNALRLTKDEWVKGSTGPRIRRRRRT